MKDRPLVGVFFVSRNNWNEFCRISTDYPIGSNYDLFVDAVNKSCADVDAAGRQAVKMDVDPAELSAWCQSRGLEVDPVSRARYIFSRMAEMEKIKRVV